MSGDQRTKDSAEGSSRSGGDHQQPQPAPLSRYESQKRRDWNTFGQYLKNQRPPVSLSQCNCNHVLDFLRYLDQFGKTKVHLHGCVFFGQPDPPAPCTCPLRQAWGSLDALIGRLRAAFEEHGGSAETNPFGNGAIRDHNIGQMELDFQNGKCWMCSFCFSTYYIARFSPCR
ncbi:hypothetical protein SADUNF_Sadunf04G0038000 [Salix dunnii]|uniref:ALOG domain-containing protein n=1 Tax=Salix dunnii TaxID=1413687 RepID=A0A835KCZ5_9ROSI|nr:hypothetical protein SADUNF_Sadunf04G0038000 [Salix dunnii]